MDFFGCGCTSEPGDINRQMQAASAKFEHGIDMLESDANA